MAALSEKEIFVLLLSLTIILFSARCAGSACNRLNIPSVIGEIVAGVLLGSIFLGNTITFQLGHFFSNSSGISYFFDGILKISSIMLLFVAGMEINVSSVIASRKPVIYISFFSLVIPFLLGTAVVWYYPELFNIALDLNAPKITFALFIGVALAISALPVLARILMDLKIINTNIGIIVMSSAVVVDIIGWLIFAVILKMHANDNSYLEIFYLFIWITAFTLFMCIFGGNVIKYLVSLNKKNKSIDSILVFLLVICFLSAMFTEYINLHAGLGAFIAGIASNKIIQQEEQLKESLNQFVRVFFSPIFFVSIGLKLDFINSFDLSLTALILVLAFFSKILGAGLGAYLSGLKPNIALAIGCGMNARGVMEIILSSIALSVGLISDSIYVSLVIMAIITSLASGILMDYFLNYRKLKRPVDCDLTIEK